MSERSIAIIGDGKMGQTIRQLAVEKGWKVAAFIGEAESAGGSGIDARTLGNADVAVEFTQPDAAVANIKASLRAGVPIVAGTTGWYDALPDVTRIAKETGQGFLWSPNFSLGRSTTYELARYAGTLMRTWKASMRTSSRRTTRERRTRIGDCDCDWQGCDRHARPADTDDEHQGPVPSRERTS